MHRRDMPTKSQCACFQTPGMHGSVFCVPGMHPGLRKHGPALALEEAWNAPRRQAAAASNACPRRPSSPRQKLWSHTAHRRLRKSELVCRCTLQNHSLQCRQLEAVRRCFVAVLRDSQQNSTRRCRATDELPRASGKIKRELSMKVDHDVSPSHQKTRTFHTPRR